MHILDIENAAARIKGVIHNIRLTSSRTFSELSGCTLYLKHENQQKTGSFKVRGAYNKIAKLVEEGTLTSIVASSAGNHAQGVAYAAQSLGITATIVMPRSTPIAKVSATEGYGAAVVLHGDCYDDAYQKALQIQEDTGAVFIHPFDDEDVIAGQGTIGLEVLRDLPNVDMVIVPAGGGGMLAGIAFCIKQINPRVQIVGVQAEGADAISQSFECSDYKCTLKVNTIADGIAVKNPGVKTVPLIQEYVDQVVTVTDAEIAETILLLLERSKQVVEPAGAVSLAAALSGRIDVAGKKVACILSGGNIDVSFIHKIVEKGLVKRERKLKLRTVMLDVPGSLQHFSSVVAKTGANVIMVQYDRFQADLNLNEVILHVAFEVTGPDHAKILISSLKKAGYPVSVE